MLMNNLPNLEPRTVKDKIVLILTDKFPLSIKGLKKELKEKYNTPVSYQAIYKVILELLELKIIAKKEKKFLLDKEWVKKMYYLSEQTYINYSKIKKYSINILKELKNEGDILTLNFESISELDKYSIGIMDYFHEILEKDEKIIMCYKHNWWPLLYSKKEDEINKKDPINSRFYCLCGSNTPIDKWACKFENKIGMNVKYSKDAAKNWDIQIYHDLIVQFHIDVYIMNKIDRFFSKYKSVRETDLKEFIDILNTKGNIKVVIIKNYEIANQIRKDTIKLFRT